MLTLEVKTKREDGNVMQKAKRQALGSAAAPEP
jgi:hypothetical protein